MQGASACVGLSSSWFEPHAQSASGARHAVHAAAAALARGLSATVCRELARSGRSRGRTHARAAPRWAGAAAAPSSVHCLALPSHKLAAFHEIVARHYKHRIYTQIYTALAWANCCSLRQGAARQPPPEGGRAAGSPPEGSPFSRSGLVQARLPGRQEIGHCRQRALQHSLRQRAQAFVAARRQQQGARGGAEGGRKGGVARGAPGLALRRAPQPSAARRVEWPGGSGTPRRRLRDRGCRKLEVRPAIRLSWPVRGVPRVLVAADGGVGGGGVARPVACRGATKGRTRALAGPQRVCTPPAAPRGHAPAPGPASSEHRQPARAGRAAPVPACCSGAPPSARPPRPAHARAPGYPPSGGLRSLARSCSKAAWSCSSPPSPHSPAAHLAQALCHLRRRVAPEAAGGWASAGAGGIKHAAPGLQAAGKPGPPDICGAPQLGGAARGSSWAAAACRRSPPPSPPHQLQRLVERVSRA